MTVFTFARFQGAGNRCRFAGWGKVHRTIYEIIPIMSSFLIVLSPPRRHESHDFCDIVAALAFVAVCFLTTEVIEKRRGHGVFIICLCRSVFCGWRQWFNVLLWIPAFAGMTIGAPGMTVRERDEGPATVCEECYLSRMATDRRTVQFILPSSV